MDVAYVQIHTHTTGHNTSIPKYNIHEAMAGKVSWIFDRTILPAPSGMYCSTNEYNSNALTC